MKRRRRKSPAYRVAHWGLAGPHEDWEGAAPDPRDGPLVELGELVNVVYRTRKGGERRAVEYTHDFGDAKGRDRPVLCYNRVGRLIIVGGVARVTWRGIVG